MSEFKNRTNKSNVGRASAADQAPIDALIAGLADDDGLVRQRARESLVDMGEQAAAPLIEELADPNGQVRWEAAKALSEIGDPAAAPALVNALEDKKGDIRWLAAEGLIVLERRGLPPLLQALVERSGSEWLREGAHHVLHDLAGKKGLGDLVSPVLAALENVEPALEAPLAARAALDTLAQEPGHSR
jgi:hypothetical protein